MQILILLHKNKQLHYTRTYLFLFKGGFSVIYFFDAFLKFSDGAKKYTSASYKTYS